MLDDKDKADDNAKKQPKIKKQVFYHLSKSSSDGIQMKALELRDWCVTIKDWMRNNENINDLPVYVLVLACEIPNFT